MFVGDFRIQPQKGREEGVLRVRAIDIDRRFGDDGSHIVERDGSGGTVIKQDRVRRRPPIRKGNVHHCTSQQHVRRRINAFDSSARRIELFDGRVIIAEKRTEQTTIVFHITIDGARKAV